ncbi:Hypothetical predicted protein [Mytilus galloprovincialis]|uniref:Uncharacterized protein n=1 Tax=Mytilus galloprovincialis TaxID=29158 RepID=A0A8B6FYV2_MYTGA|nr:Hypothetical predicted protein [Mytilus galloprovincialis]
MRSLTTSIHKIQATVNAKFLEFGNRLDLMESRGLSQDPVQDPPRPPRQLLEDDSVSLAPRSQEGNFLDDQGDISDVDRVVSTEGDAFIPKEPSSCNSDCLRSLVYSIFKDMSCLPMSSPPRVSSTPSDFMACSGQREGIFRLEVYAASGRQESWNVSIPCLLLGTVANLTLAKRQEILDKSTVSEALQQRLVSSPLSKDKLFSVSLEQLQEEVNEAPPVVKVDVKVTDGKRFVKTTQVNNPSSHQPKASTSSSSKPTKRSAFFSSQLFKWEESC